MRDGELQAAQTERSRRALSIHACRSPGSRRRPVYPDLGVRPVSGNFEERTPAVRVQQFVGSPRLAPAPHNRHLRAVSRVPVDWRIDNGLRPVRHSIDHSEVGLFRCPCFELAAQRRLRRRCLGEQQDSRRVLVKAMDEAGGDIEGARASTTPSNQPHARRIARRAVETARPAFYACQRRLREHGQVESVDDLVRKVGTSSLSMPRLTTSALVPRRRSRVHAPVDQALDTRTRGLRKAEAGASYPPETARSGLGCGVSVGFRSIAHITEVLEVCRTANDEGKFAP